MKQEIFTIFDNKAKAFLKPFFTRNADTALRMIKELIMTEPNHELARYKHDYELYSIGTYDDNQGMLDSYAPAHIQNLAQLTWDEAPPGKVTASEEQIADYDHAQETKKAVNS